VPLDLRGLTDEAASHAEAGEVGDDLRWIRFERDQKLVARHLARASLEPAADEGAMFSSSAAHLTPDELEAFSEEFVALLKRYWREPDDRSPDAVPVAVLFYACPWPGEPR
jgi:hypothetical protein